ncbi:MAG: pilus assembly protein TadG-related protein [Hyphomonadaceae bacterium]|nr:pilus assembly protein TadG-related protein [Hyphomonadaceae bacterium]
MRRLARDRRGSVITVFAFSAMVLAVLTAIVMNQISFYMAKRQLQSAVDMAALMVMESGVITVANAKALLEEQLDQPVSNVIVTQGRYSADAGVAAANRFTPNAAPFNALQLSARIPGDKVMLAGMMAGTPMIDASARAARRTTASVVMGSRLVRVEGGLSAALLDAALGYKGKLTVMDYESLASANVDAGQFLRMLNTRADIKAVTFDDVVSAPVSVGELVDAMVATTPNGSIQALLKKSAPVSGTDKVLLNEIIDLGSISNLPIDSLLSGETFPLSIGEVLTGSAALADGDQQIAINLAAVLGDASIANASLDVGEKPQVLNYQGRAGEGTKLSTSQFALNIGALGVLKVDVTLANAAIEIDDIKCKADGSAEVVLKAVTEAASVGVKAPILPRIAVKLGSGEAKKLTFSKSDIQTQTYKPVRSGLGLQLGSLSIAQKLLFTPVDSLLEKLGLHIAEADVKVTEATCGTAGLVH